MRIIPVGDVLILLVASAPLKVCLMLGGSDIGLIVEIVISSVFVQVVVSGRFLIFPG